MNDNPHTFSLTSRQGPAPVFVGASAEGRLDGILLELTLRQTYRNSASEVLEVVYTFPLPARAVLLGFASELGGVRQVGAVVARRQAELRYERALAAGDAPVMLEAHDGGLHTANIGNLKPGEEIVLEVRYAQVLAFEQGRLRLAIPTTVAPRFGMASLAGLQQQQVPEPTLEAEHRLRLSLSVGASLSRAQLECPTHRCAVQASEGGQTLKLLPGARLDRDVVILVQPLEQQPSFVVRAGDERSDTAPRVALAAFQPPKAPLREAVALKILVDCSGSMGGDSIASARMALQGVLADLSPGDRVSLTRFGTTVDHVSDVLPASPPHLADLQASVLSLQADLGGTEMQGALQEVFELGARGPVPMWDVLLLTDGQVWHAKPLIDAARRSRHRVFAIGVGSASAEGVLRPLAEATGGACEFATPGESLQAAARHMMRRIRQQVWHEVSVDWGAPPVWQLPLPMGVFAGDTVVALAGFKASAPSQAVRLLAPAERGDIELARGEADVTHQGDTLARIAAARCAAAADDAGDVASALDLCLRYQLMSRHAHCVLVHPRADGEAVDTEALLHRVNPMLAAGWGAMGSVLHAPAAEAAPVMPMSCNLVMPVDDDLFGCSGVPPLALRSVGATPPSPLTPAPALPFPLPEPTALRDIAASVAEHFAWGGDVPGLAALGRRIRLHADLQPAWNGALALGASPAQVWLLLAHWVHDRRQGLGSIEWVEALRRPVDALDALNAQLVQRCMALFDRQLAGLTIDRWNLSREERLRRAMTRTGS